MGMMLLKNGKNEWNNNQQLETFNYIQSQEISNFTGAVMNPSQSDLMKNGPRTTEPLYFLVIHYIARVYSMILAGVSVELVNP